MRFIEILPSFNDPVFYRVYADECYVGKITRETSPDNSDFYYVWVLPGNGEPVLNESFSTLDRAKRYVYENLGRAERSTFL